MKNLRFYSHGKLLITAEYLVLDGVQALALPTKYGQDLTVFPSENEEIYWKSIDVNGDVWMEEHFAISRIFNQEIAETDSDYLKTLLSILRAAHEAKPDFFSKAKGFYIETRLEFPRLWGLGTSSTLINNIAQWVEVDAFWLLDASFGGSGYDIACAQRDTPILYTKTKNGACVVELTFKPKFSEYLYFVYLNQKQSSKAGIAKYREYQGDLKSKQSDINAITEQLLIADTLEKFEELLEQHETVIASVIGMPKVKKMYFDDFDGVVKSLGAWGGDFVLVTSKKNPKAYFKAKGFDTVLAYDEIIL